MFINVTIQFPCTVCPTVAFIGKLKSFAVKSISKAQILIELTGQTCVKFYMNDMDSEGIFINQFNLKYINFQFSNKFHYEKPNKVLQ